MARRQIGQEHLALSRAEPRGGAALGEVAALIDWAEMDRLLAGILASAKGEPGWPPLALSGHSCWPPGTTFPTCAWPKRSTTGPAFAGSVALPLTSPRPSAPPLSASAPSCCAAAWTGPCSRRSHVSSISARLWCAPARWSTPPRSRPRAPGMMARRAGPVIAVQTRARLQGPCCDRPRGRADPRDGDYDRQRP